MITVKDYLEAVDYRITGGSDFGWNCYGPNARYMDCQSEDINGYSVHAIFDTLDQTVYSIEAWDYVNNNYYRWIHPAYVKNHMAECAKHNVDVYNAFDDVDFTELDVAADILEKAKAIVLQKPYDTRVQVEVDFSDEDMLQYMKLAHELDITFNELVERALREAIDAAQENKRNYCED